MAAREKSPAKAGLLPLDYRLDPLLCGGPLLLEPEPDVELGDVFWFALG